MIYRGSNEQLCNALECIASRASTGCTDAVVCQAAADRLRALTGDAEPDPKTRILEGPIEVGQEFIWEPDKPHARLNVVVSRISPVDHDETRIWAHEIGQSPETASWNDESRFREACVRMRTHAG